MSTLQQLFSTHSADIKFKFHSVFDLDCYSLVTEAQLNSFIMGLVAFDIVTGIGAAIIALPILAPAVLPLIGFSAVGPVAGGLAAGAQAFVGSVAAGFASLFQRYSPRAMAAPTPYVS